VGRWVRFADSSLVANVRAFIFMILRRAVGFVLVLLGVDGCALRKAVGNASALAQGPVDGAQEDR
jgi:hypothetical protein